MAFDRRLEADPRVVLAFWEKFLGSAPAQISNAIPMAPLRMG